MADRVIRCGVVGAGVFGGYHARKIPSLPGAVLAGVSDPQMAKARALADPLGAPAFDDYDALLAFSDAIIVTAPADAHADLARRALAAGKPVYVEKPLATTSQDAWALVEAAAKAGLTLACGHQERLVMNAMGLFDTDETAFRMEAVRRGPPSDRNLDVSCVQDLMVHDLDLAQALAGGEVEHVEAVGDANEVRAGVTFTGGLTALFEASRIAEARARTMDLLSFRHCRDRFPGAILPQSDLFQIERGLRRDASRAGHPLGASLAAFLSAIRGEAARPAITGEEGARAVDLALAVERAAGV